jgi:sulfate/thiosulfate transport system permease protein
MSSARSKNFQILPGFGLSLGYTLTYLSLVVLIPLGALFLRTTELTWTQFWKIATSDRAVASYQVTFGSAFAAAVINAVMGTLLAWVIVRYRFPGRRILDGLIDFPFALPTAVAGLTLANLFATTGWLGRWLDELGIQVAYTQSGIVVALIFIGIPFVVRSLQPVLEDIELEVEEAAASLGASRFTTFTRVIFPTLLPAILTGFSLAFARAIGEYGSVIFIAPKRAEITPMLIWYRLEEFDYPGAMAIAVVMLVISFFLLITVNLLERWASRFQR